MHLPRQALHTFKGKFMQSSKSSPPESHHFPSPQINNNNWLKNANIPLKLYWFEKNRFWNNIKGDGSSIGERDWIDLIVSITATNEVTIKQDRPIKFNSNQSPLPRLSSTPSIKYRTQGEENGSKKTVLSFLSERHSQIKEKGKRIGKENDLWSCIY